jgi:hypothetical protein
LPGAVAIYVASPAQGELRQGEIISNLIQARLDFATVGLSSPPKIDLVTHQFAVVVSQDCDLLLDYNVRNGIGDVKPDKLLPSILFCEVATAEEMCRAENGINGRDRQLFGKNKLERFHFLQKVEREKDGMGEGLPELGIDFKRYFSIPTDEVYKRVTLEAKRRCYMSSPYLEHLSNRFAHFQQRIALPEDHRSE